jgi:hypothetical protein
MVSRVPSSWEAVETGLPTESVNEDDMENAGESGEPRTTRKTRDEMMLEEAAASLVQTRRAKGAPTAKPAANGSNKPAPTATSSMGANDITAEEIALLEKRRARQLLSASKKVENKALTGVNADFPSLGAGWSHDPVFNILGSTRSRMIALKWKLWVWMLRVRAAVLIEFPRARWKRNPRWLYSHDGRHSHGQLLGSPGKSAPAVAKTDGSRTVPVSRKRHLQRGEVQRVKAGVPRGMKVIHLLEVLIAASAAWTVVAGHSGHDKLSTGGEAWANWPEDNQEPPAAHWLFERTAASVQAGPSAISGSSSWMPPAEHWLLEQTAASAPALPGPSEVRGPEIPIAASLPATRPAPTFAADIPLDMPVSDIGNEAEQGIPVQVLRAPKPPTILDEAETWGKLTLMKARANEDGDEMSWMQGSSSSSAYSSSRRPTTAPGSASSTEDFPMRKKKKSEPKETDAEIRAQTASGGTSKPLTVFSVPASTCPARTPATSVVVQPEGEEACLEDCEVCGNWTCNEDMLGHAGLHLCQGCQRHAGYAPGTRLRFAADDGLRSWRKQRLPRPDDEEEEAQAPGVLTARPAPPPNQAWEEAMSVVFAECRTAEEARHLCKALAVHYHPDKGGSEQRFRLLQEICGRAERAAEEQQEAEADASSLMQGLQQPGQEDPTSRNEAEEDTSSFMQQPGSESEPDSEASNSWDPLAALEARRLWRKWRRGDFGQAIQKIWLDSTLGSCDDGRLPWERGNGNVTGTVAGSTHRTDCQCYGLVSPDPIR